MDASEKWCPWARSYGLVRDGFWVGGINRCGTDETPEYLGIPEPDCLCIKDRCIAWRRYWRDPQSVGPSDIPNGANAFYDCALIRGREGMVAE